MECSVNNPKISILMSGYKTNIGLLKRTLESISSQTYRNFELVFIDDGCSSDTIDSLLKYQNSFPIVLLQNPINLGLPKSLNRGLAVAKGEYIARLDDDDIITCDRLEKQLQYLEDNPEYVGCWSEFTYIDSDDNEIGKSCIKGIDFLKTFIKKGNCCCHSSLFIKKSILQEIAGYNEKYLYAQDMELYLRILQKYRMGCVDDYLVKFRVNTTRNPIDKKILAFVFSFSAAVKFVYYNRKLIFKFLILVRFFVVFKFVFFDILKELDN